MVHPVTCYMHYNCFTDNHRHGKALLGVLDYVWLFPYALAMFVRYLLYVCTILNCSLGI